MRHNPNVTMSALHEYVTRSRPSSIEAKQLKDGWNLWYNNLSWYEKNVGSPATIKNAQDRITAMRTIGSLTQFGIDPLETIRMGSSGTAVSRWQQILGLPITGIFDNATHAATLNYQRSKDLTVDGVVGPMTWGSVPAPSTPLSPVKNLFAPIKSFVNPQTALFGLAAIGGIIAAVLIPSKK